MNSAKVRRWRKSKGIGQAELARLLQCSRDRIVKLEQGDRPVRHELSLALAWIHIFGPDDPWSWINKDEMVIEALRNIRDMAD